MIITQEALLAINGCPTIVQHLVDTGYEGLTRRQFVQKLQEDADAGLHPQWWVRWIKVYLYNGDAICKLGEYTKTHRYDINGMNIPEGLQIFTDLNKAILAIKKLQAEQIASEEWMFHVHAKCPEGQDAHTLHTCDLDGDGVFDHEVECYQAFNHITGEYECFDTFEEAKVKCDILKLERIEVVYSSYSITEEIHQINDPEENPTGWIVVDVGDALKYQYEGSWYDCDKIRLQHGTPERERILAKQKLEKEKQKLQKIIDVADLYKINNLSIMSEQDLIYFDNHYKDLIPIKKYITELSEIECDPLFPNVVWPDVPSEIEKIKQEIEKLQKLIIAAKSFRLDNSQFITEQDLIQFEIYVKELNKRALILGL